ncbi:hypothetical protein Ahy_B10g103037 [Arachis hypogaea]|uniref:Uncharacterized protein n=1 Tax=Arachis hypogaea TaxID=3818 RepID=A0A444X389_ARAHY|nr:hypothetical protein Ahy_B10g103037 [Arachis hypogaea]
MSTPPLGTDTAVSEPTHGSQPNSPSLLPIEKFIWEKTHNGMIRKIFDHQMARQLQQMMQDVRKKRDHLTQWLCLAIKNEPYIHWESDEGFWHRRLTNRANRASSRSLKYTDGFVTFVKTKARLYKSLDCDVTIGETFKYTHTLNENKERFSYQQSADPYVSLARSAFEPYKNCVYGLRSFFTNNLYTSRLKAYSASATSPVDPKDSIDLREQVQNLTQSLHQQAQQLQQSEMRFNKILACASDTDFFKLELRQEMERIQRMQQQIAVYHEQMHAGDSGAARGALTSSPRPP